MEYGGTKRKRNFKKKKNYTLFNPYNRLKSNLRQAHIYTIDLKRITRCKLASIFTSADHRKFLGLFGAIDL